MRERFDAIVALTDDFCQRHLNADYAQLARHTAAALSRKRPSPLARGRPDTWACGIVYALGSVNFLFDPGTEPHLSAAELCEKFGVGKSTGSAKSRAVQDALDMTPLDAQWLLPSMGDPVPGRKSPLASLSRTNTTVPENVFAGSACGENFGR